jgi:Predicted tagatose 6-phosphate kinase
MNKLSKFASDRRCTLLGVGPVSKNCVDAAIELSNEYSVPLMLIASRRQIEMAKLGGGYVNNWSTEAFAKYVIDQDKGGKIILARDHGGPWQHPTEVSQNLSLRRAMESAKASFETDINSGFDMIHIDPCIDIHNARTVDDILERVYELYEFCYQTAQKKGRELLFEVGTDEQGATVQDLDQFEYVLASIVGFCRKSGLPRPTFIVAQTGTKVMEMQNVGTFDSPFRLAKELPVEIQIPRLLQICQKYDVWLKEHNVDYLSDDSLAWHPKLGIHAVNVAPEFGVIETRALLKLFLDSGLKSCADQFVELSYSSRKWEKWMRSDTKMGTVDRAMIAGHYVFADSRCVEIKQEAQRRLSGLDIDAHLRSVVKRSIYRYMKLFNLLDCFHRGTHGSGDYHS